jgi:hypothetical protein
MAENSGPGTTQILESAFPFPSPGTIEIKYDRPAANNFYWMTKSACAKACLVCFVPQVTRSPRSARLRRLRLGACSLFILSGAPRRRSRRTRFAFETALTKEIGERVDLDEVSLDVARLCEPGYGRSPRRLYAEKVGPLAAGSCGPSAIARGRFCGDTSHTR